MRSNFFLKSLWILMTISLIATANLHADVIRLKSGEILIGKVTGQSGASITVYVDEKKRNVYKRNIRKISYGDAEKARAIEEKRKALAIRKSKLVEAQRQADKQQKEDKENEQLAALLDSIKQLKAETSSLEAELQQAREEAEKIRSERAQEIQKGSGKDIDDWIVQKSTSVALGSYDWKSSAANIAFRMEGTRMINLAAAGWPTAQVAITDPASSLGVTDSLRLNYKSRSPVDGITDEYGMFYASSEFSSVIAGRRASAAYTYNDILTGSGTLAVNQGDTEFQVHQKPKVTHLDLIFRKHFEFFNQSENKYLEPLTFHIGGALTGDSLETSSSFAVNTRTTSLTPYDANSEALISYGSGPRIGTFKYGQGSLSLDVGFSYAMSFFKQHMVDLRWNKRTGLYSAGNFENNSNGLFSIAGLTLPISINSNGDFKYKYSGDDYEFGYSFFYEDFRFRIFYMNERRKISITESDLSNNYDWFFILSNLTSNNYAPMVALDFMDPMGPLPESAEQIKGTGFEVTYYF